MDTGSTAAFDLIRGFISRQFGIHYIDEKFSVLEQQLIGVCRSIGVANFGELYAQLIRPRNSEVIEVLVEFVTINHTHFYREMCAYEQFVESILPRLRALPTIRVWSAASASGEELYTLLMVLAEEIGMDELTRYWKFLGTDINHEMVARAERGEYSAKDVAKIPAKMRERYLEKLSDGRYRVIEQLRGLCTFRRLNLAAPPYPFELGFHVTFCRNVLYYFDDATQKKVLGAIFAATRNQGWLLTSRTETIDHLGTRWRRQLPSIYTCNFGSQYQTLAESRHR